MIQAIQNIKDRLTGKVPSDMKRSPHWPMYRDAYLRDFPSCAICEGKKSLQVHHRKPFHLHPEMELERANFITLCEAPGTNCHLVFGHAGNFKGYNEFIDSDALEWAGRFHRSDAISKGAP